MSVAQYDNNLALIEAHNSAEPLLPVLRKGFSAVNAMYMAVAIKRMPTVLEEDEQEAPVKPKNKPVASESGKTPDQTLRGLWAERTRLFGQMNRQSNLFHSCKTNEERAATSQKVLAWWSDIQAVKAEIEYYEQHGKKAEKEQEGEVLSENPVALSKQLASIRAKISQTKSKIVEVAGLDANTPGKEGKINAYETKLRNLNHLRGLADQKLKSYGQAQ